MIRSATYSSTSPTLASWVAASPTCSTHFHADFVAGHVELRDRENATIHLGARANAEFAFVAMGAVVEASRELQEDGTYGFWTTAGAGVKAWRDANR